jgi:hypothetical protein
MKTFMGFCVFGVLLVISGFVTLLMGHIILSLGGLYGLDFITKFSLLEMFGFLLVLSIAMFKYKKETTKTDFWDSMGEGLNVQLNKVLTLLVVWGLGFFFHWLFTAFNIN